MIPPGVETFLQRIRILDLHVVLHDLVEQVESPDLLILDLSIFHLLLKSFIDLTL